MKWSRAEQAVGPSFLEKLDRAADLKAAPQAFFAGLRGDGRTALAVEFLAQAMPRLEAVVWAADTVRDLSPNLSSTEADALRAVMQWIADPTEARRRSAADAAQGCEPSAPAWMAAMAAFYSGGSVAPADCEPLPPPADAAARFAAGAILLACADLDDMDGALNQCLEHGERLAVDGLGGRSRR